MQSIHIIEDTLPAAWENAVVKCWEVGESFPTEYDKPNDPNSRDVTALIHVKNPMKEPRIHRAFPGGLDDLEKYRSEVLYGVHDHWCDPGAGKWNYTYHSRLFNYSVPGKPTIDQVAAVIDALKKCGYTRRAQAVTWKAWEDLGISDPSCLQRLWFRIQNDKCIQCNGTGIEIWDHEVSDTSDCSRKCPYCNGKGNIPKLNMNIHIRSNDAFLAGYMNCYAFVELQAWIAEQLGVEVGEYIHIADSFHIYGAYFERIEGFLKTIEDRDYSDRVYDTEFALPFFIDGCDTLLGEADMPSDKRELVLRRKASLENQIASL